MLYDKRWDKQVEAPVEGWRKVLLDAANEIRANGWCQGKFHDAKGASCTLGAIIRVGWKDREEIQRAVDKLSNHIGSQCIAGWNDTRGRTVDEVIATLEDTARLS